VREEIKMASAKAKTTEKTRMVEEKYHEVTGYTLELTQDEAAFLSALIGFKVGGRLLEKADVCLDIYRALKGAGVYYSGNSDVAETVRKFNSGMSGFVRLG
jgi:hypothetical protein